MQTHTHAQCWSSHKKTYVCKGFDQGPGAIGRSLRSACLYTYIRISQHVRNTMSVIETVFAVWKASKPWPRNNINPTYTLRLWECSIEASAIWMCSFGLPNKKRCGSHKSLWFSLFSLFVRVGKFAVSCIVRFGSFDGTFTPFFCFLFLFCANNINICSRAIPKRHHQLLKLCAVIDVREIKLMIFDKSDEKVLKAILGM